MKGLPYEIFKNIASFLSLKDVCTIMHVNRYLHYIGGTILYHYPDLYSKHQLESFSKIPRSKQSLIKYLDFSNVHENVNDDTLKNLKYLDSLKSINFSKCTKLSIDCILKLIEKNFRQLHTLILTDCTISNTVLECIGKANRHYLTHLDLTNTMIKPCAAFDSFNHLDSMFISNKDHTHRAANLRYLDLSFCCWVDEHTVQNIIFGLPRLETINLQWCNQIKHNSILMMAKKLTYLTTIDISHIPSFNDSKVLNNILNNSKSLKKIIFTYRTLAAELKA